MTHVYAAHGLRLAVPFPCPTLRPAEGPADVTVEEGAVPRALDAPLLREEGFDAAPGRYLLRGGRYAGRFLVRDGCSIILERNPGCQDRFLEFHFLHSVLAALLRQRGHLVLHGNAVAGPDGAVVLCGASGAGKSTTMAALLWAGWQALTDDVTCLCLSPETGRVMVPPGAAQVSLCVDAAERLGDDVAARPRNPAQHNKVTVPVAGADAATPLAGLVLLRTETTGEGVRGEILAGAEKFAALQSCIYGPLFPQEHVDCFAVQAALAEGIPVRRILRAGPGWSLDAVVRGVMSGSGGGWAV